MTKSIYTESLIGPEGRVKITDFGIAHAAGQAPVTDPGFVMGTANYLAPERISGSAGTPACDLYALGIVLHECLTGLPPYDGTPAEVMAGHLYLPLPPLPADAPPELGRLVAWLTAKDPVRRLDDANEVAVLAGRLRTKMRHASGSSSVSSSNCLAQPGLPRTLQRWPRRAAHRGALVKKYDV